MNSFINFITKPRVITLLATIFIFMIIAGIARFFGVSWIWLIALGLVLIISYVVYWLIQRHKAENADAQLTAMLEQQSDAANKGTSNLSKDEVQKLRDRLHDAIKTIRTSKLGEVSGSAALYELPWYMVIGNPAAGKSSAVKNSGLKFPFSDNTGPAVQGIGGTRNCDWFFTTEGILLDTAGRYAIHEEDRKEWLGFLQLLRKYRPKSPINGIIIGVSIAELSQNKPEYAIQLAKNLRQRVQELTENLEIFAPVYILFTKMDLLSGFVDFFEDTDEAERDRVWGATLPLESEQKTDAVTRFDEQFDVLFEGLKELSVTRMSLNRKQSLTPGLMTFPIEFSSIRPALRTFVATLFEDNPFQFKPIFRGFYFTSALQEGVATSPLSARMASRFALTPREEPKVASIIASHGLFLRDLFSKVIFADKHLVRQYSSRRKRQIRNATFLISIATLGLALGLWTWSYMGNQQLVTNAQADLDKVLKLQQNRQDLASRLEALEILQDRIEQLRRYRDDTPLSLQFGLYQGNELENRLRKEYFDGIQLLLLKPVSTGLETFLADVNAHGSELKAMDQPVSATPKAATQSTQQTYTELSPTNVEDGYNALKTYLMLANREHLDPGHLNDQMTRFWRTWLESNRGDMPREQMIRSGEKIMTFVLSQTAAPDFPVIDNNLALVDSTRENLRRVVKGMPARERVYAEIKLRASSRFPAITVANIIGEDNKDVMSGSYVISGTFTREAWEGYVEQAIKDSATNETSNTDWVLKTASNDDLTLEGSPEQIQKTLTAMYKAEYIREWQKFIQVINVQDFSSFEEAVNRINRLGDPSISPLYKLMEIIYNQTSWDNPSALNKAAGKAKTGFSQWFKESILRQTPKPAAASNPGMQAGPIGREFAVVAQLMTPRADNGDTSMMKTYLSSLTKLRSRFNQLKTAGDYGPGSIQLVKQTLDGSGSELSDSLKFVDEQMLNGVSDKGKATMRPMLVRPLMQAFAVLLKPAEHELNKSWAAEIYAPFNQNLGGKYPFRATGASVEASNQEIAKVFGAEGDIAKFAEKTIGPLVVRRGETLNPRTWAEMGITLNPEFSANFGRYVAAVAGGGTSASPAVAGPPQTSFQILPTPTSGLLEYSIEIDGQVLRYRNGTQAWSSFVWPNQTSQPGVKITAVTFEGNTVELLNVPGNFGLEKMISSAQRKRIADGHFELTWSTPKASVVVEFKLISSAQANASGEPASQGLRGLTLPAAIAGTGE